MSHDQLNGAFRFLLELAAIFIFGLWGYNHGEGGSRILFAILMPLGFAFLWGIFAVRDDPSRSGKTVINTPGIIRLLIELDLFALSVWMLIDLDRIPAGLTLGGLVLLHYILSHKRIAWLLRQK